MFRKGLRLGRPALSIIARPLTPPVKPLLLATSLSTHASLRAMPVSILHKESRFLSTLTDEEMKKAWDKKLKECSTFQEIEDALTTIVLGRDIDTVTLRDQYQVLKKAREIGLIKVDPEMKILDPDSSTLEESHKVVFGIKK